MKLPVMLLLGVLLMPMASHGAGLGRFFTDPETRLALDEAASRSGKVVNVEDLERKKQEKKKENRYVTLNGVVKRSGGASTVWINGVSSLKGGEDFSGLVMNGGMGDGAVRYQQPGGAEEVTMVPGQTLATGKGEVKERYEVKELYVKPEPPKQGVEPGQESESGAEGEPKMMQKGKEEGAPPPEKSVEKKKPKKSKEMEEADKLEEMLKEASKLKAVSDHYSKTLEGVIK